MNRKYKAILQDELLKKMYGNLSDSEKELFALYSINDRRQDEMMAVLRRNGAQLQGIEEMVKKQTFLSDMFANVAGNFLSDGILWLGGKILKNIKI